MHRTLHTYVSEQQSDAANLRNARPNSSGKHQLRTGDWLRRWLRPVQAGTTQGSEVLTVVGIRLKGVSFDRYAPLFCLAVILASAARGSANPTTRCEARASAAVRASEAVEVNHRLSPGYHALAITPGKENQLRVVVPFETATAAERHVPVSDILDIWEYVLTKYHCLHDYATIEIEFVSARGKVLFTEASGFTD
jgi:hypothetical protein